MNKQLIYYWNKVVPKDGIVYHLGDFSFRESCGFAVDHLTQLNGNIHLVAGNHDAKLVKKVAFREKFLSITTHLTLEVEKPDGKMQTIILTHFPQETWFQMSRGAWHFYGHTHASLDSDGNKPRRLHVGVDGNNYAPLSFLDVNNLITQKSLQEQGGYYE